MTTSPEHDFATWIEQVHANLGKTVDQITQSLQTRRDEEPRDPQDEP